MKEQTFSTSRELRIFFNEEFERWKSRTDGSLRELAEKCGVSPSYLSQIGRYGRIPGRPVMLLLALNFELADPQRLLQLCEVDAHWPYRTGTGLRTEPNDQNSFLTVKLDMQGLAEQLQGMLKKDRQSSKAGVSPLKSSLKVGLNPMQHWMHLESGGGGGLFAEFCAMLGVALQREIKLVSVPFSRYRQALAADEIDLYGPVMRIPAPTEGLHFFDPFFRVGIAALFRLRGTDGLAAVKQPTRFQQLHDSEYHIAVLRNAVPHLVVNTRLKRPDLSLILCDSDDEAIDRMLLRGVKDPAHVFICNALYAARAAKQNPQHLKLLFADSHSFVDYEEVSMALSPNLREHAKVVQSALDFLLQSGGFKERFERLFEPHELPFLDFLQRK